MGESKPEVSLTHMDYSDVKSHDALMPYILAAAAGGQTHACRATKWRKVRPCGPCVPGNKMAESFFIALKRSLEHWWMNNESHKKRTHLEFWKLLRYSSINALSLGISIETTDQMISRFKVWYLWAVTSLSPDIFFHGIALCSFLKDVDNDLVNSPILINDMQTAFLISGLSENDLKFWDSRSEERRVGK